MMRFLATNKVPETDEEKTYREIGDSIETDVLESIEYVVGEVTRMGIYDLFTYNHNRERNHDDNYCIIEGLNLRQNYLLNQEQRINCAYEKTKEMIQVFYECARRG